MKHRIGRTVAACAVFLLAACEPSVAPEPRLEPVATRQIWLLEDGAIDQVLRALHPGQPVDPAQRETIRRLALMMARTPAPPAGSTTPPEPSPAMQQALREIGAAEGDIATIMQILQRVSAESANGRGR
jgi:hypothetical protein